MHGGRPKSIRRHQGHAMGVRTISLAMLASAVVASCSTAAQRQAAAIQAKTAGTSAKSKSCIADIVANAKYASIAKHIPLDGSPPTLEKKPNQSLATPEQPP